MTDMSSCPTASGAPGSRPLRDRMDRLPSVALASLSTTALIAFLLVVVLAPPASAGSVTVTGEAQLRKALEDPEVDVVVLGADVALQSCEALVREGPGDITIDGGGHRIHQACAPSVLLAAGVDSTTLRDLHIVGAPHDDPGPTLKTRDVLLRRVTISDAPGHVVSSTGRIDASQVVITDSGGTALSTSMGSVGQGSTVRCSLCRLVGNSTNGISAMTEGSTVTVNRSEISRNGSSGIIAYGGPWVIASTLEGNGLGGVTSAGYVRVLNSTITKSGGYGIRSLNEEGPGQNGTAVVVMSTLVDNGHYNIWTTNGATAHVSVLTGSVLMNCFSPKVGGTASFSDDTTCGLDEHSHEGPDVDPRLGRLAYNGGATPTMRPLRDSPLIEGAPWEQCRYFVEDWYAEDDQRGWSRPAAPSGPCDIGAVQLGGSPLHECPVHFSDVEVEHPFCWDIDWMAGNDLGTGWPDGTYRPGLDVSRQALAAFLWRLAGSPETGGGPSFVDVPPGHQFAGAIAWMAESGISEGYDDGTFRPSEPITRQALAAMLWRLAGSPAAEGASPTFSDVPPGHPFHDAVEWLNSVEVTQGYSDGSFRPGARTSRQAMAAFLHRFDGVHQEPRT